MDASALKGANTLGHSIGSLNHLEIIINALILMWYSVVSATDQVCLKT